MFVARSATRSRLRLTSKSCNAGEMVVAFVVPAEGSDPPNLKSVFDFCRESGYRRVVLDTTEQQTAAHVLYERAGCVRVGERSLGPFRVFDYVKELG